VLKRALALGPRGRDAADLYYRLGEVAREESGDEVQALAHFRQALAYDGGHEPSIAAVEAAAREAKDWPLLADMLARREAVTADAAQHLAILLELAELYSKRLGSPETALPLLERAAQAAPNDTRILGPLADLYFAAGRVGDAAPIYARLADEARAARRMKDVARYRQRQGGILEASGDVPGALAAYEEAFRVNPTDTATMAGLGRIYMAQEAWDKAQRVYRTLVLQNIEPDVGVTKAEVYYALGLIHVRLSEPQKAKGMFQRGLELEPGNAVIRQALQGLG
jgi:tetratricopeptide (TPR) repeat protein